MPILPPKSSRLMVSEMVAGSKEALYQGDIKDVFDLYADKCVASFGFDPRLKPSMSNANVLRQVRAFIAEFGAEDAKKIIESLFGYRYAGRYNGKIVGTSIFSSGYRWLANQLLAESLADEHESGNLWKKF